MSRAAIPGVMAAFAERFGADSAEVELLRLLGLFDRPATPERSPRSVNHRRSPD